jgi:hypothetical protein
MAELPAELEQAVVDQAEARLAMSVQGYAKYLTSAAVDSLRDSYSGVPPRVNRYDIAAVEQAGHDFIVDVRYYSRDEPFIVRSRWSLKNDSWVVLHAARLWGENDKRPGFFSRMAGSILRRLASLRG